MTKIMSFVYFMRVHLVKATKNILQIHFTEFWIESVPLNSASPRTPPAPCGQVSSDICTQPGTAFKLNVTYQYLTERYILAMCSSSPSFQYR